MVVVGRMKVKVNYGETNKLLFLYVVKGQGPSLMGREWLNEININWLPTMWYPQIVKLKGCLRNM